MIRCRLEEEAVEEGEAVAEGGEVRNRHQKNSQNYYNYSHRHGPRSYRSKGDCCCDTD